MRSQIVRPVWQDGMMLCPQHLQLQDLYHERHLDERLVAVSPTSWGVLSMRIEPGALKSGSLQIAEFRGIMPDGTPLTFEALSPHCPGSRMIGTFFPAKASTLDVFLALPALREGIPNYVPASRAVDSPARFVTLERDVVEHTSGRTERRVDVCVPRAQIILGAPEENQSAIKVAELVRDGGGGFSLQENYIPPCLALAGSPWLTQQVQDLLGAVVSRRREWLEDARTRDGLRVEFGAQDLTRYLYLQAISDALPVLKHYCEHLESSPLQLYLTLVQLASRLALFSAVLDPVELPVFTYDDLRSCFGRLFTELRLLLNQTLAQRYVRIPLQARRDGLWVGELKEGNMLNCSTYVLALETDKDPQVASQEISRKARIASWQRINLIVRNDVLGVPIRPTFSPPQEIPTRPRHVYFLIERDDVTWKEVISDRNIAIFLSAPYDPAQAKVSLFGILPKES